MFWGIDFHRKILGVLGFISYLFLCFTFFFLVENEWSSPPKPTLLWMIKIVIAFSLKLSHTFTHVGVWSIFLMLIQVYCARACRCHKTSSKIESQSYLSTRVKMKEKSERFYGMNCCSKEDWYEKYEVIHIKIHLFMCRCKRDLSESNDKDTAAIIIIMQFQVRQLNGITTVCIAQSARILTWSECWKLILHLYFFSPFLLSV